MQKLIITSLVLAVMLLFVSGSFAGGDEGGFKNSPLFKHSLNEAVTNMENQGKVAVAEGANAVTSAPQCNYPQGQVISLGQPTCYETCEPTQCGGECYTQAYTCNPTACGGTCAGTSTCESTCSCTSYNTCEGQNTCQNTCTCPPLVYGYVYHHAWGYPWTHDWDLQPTKQRYVFQYAPPYKIVGFDEDGFYGTRVFGEPACGLIAKGEIWSQYIEGVSGSWGWHHYESVGTYKPPQDLGDEDQVDFNVQRTK